MGATDAGWGTGFNGSFEATDAGWLAQETPTMVVSETAVFWRVSRATGSWDYSSLAGRLTMTNAEVRVFPDGVCADD